MNTSGYFGSFVGGGGGERGAIGMMEEKLGEGRVSDYVEKVGGESDLKERGGFTNNTYANNFFNYNTPTITKTK